MAITDKKTGPWGLDQVYNKINQGSIWEYSGASHLYGYGSNNWGQLGLNSVNNGYSSPVQIPGIWDGAIAGGQYQTAATKSDGTLWIWGRAWTAGGNLGQNDLVSHSSPVQIPGTTWPNDTLKMSFVNERNAAIKTDGTLWLWGNNGNGALGLNDEGGWPSYNTSRSSPTQLPGTTWKYISGSPASTLAIKTDGTLWSWGLNTQGELGQNSRTLYSSPVQVGSDATWDKLRPKECAQTKMAIKTDGTLWMWGHNSYGKLGLNQGPTQAPAISSPSQIGSETTWAKTVIGSGKQRSAAIKTDGTLWMWGHNDAGGLGQNNTIQYSSPVQVGSGTDWDLISMSYRSTTGLKTDGTLWSWGYGGQYGYGNLGQNNNISYSSPVQVGSGTDWTSLNNGQQSTILLLNA